MPRNEFQEREPFSPVSYLYSDVEEVHTRRSPFQSIRVLRHPFFGAILVLDDIVQLTERDEFFYHELLAHVPLMVHPSPARVLILGGGDGGSLREVLKHRAVKSATVVEIDPDVVEVSKNFLPSLSVGFDDPRTRVIYMDGAEFIRDVEGAFDVIIVDAPDPVGPAQSLLSLEALRAAERALTPDGILAAQTESLHFHREFLVEVQKNLQGLFPIVDLYTQAIATYPGSWWTFSIASKQFNPRSPRRRAKLFTRYYSPEVHRRAFLPPRLYERLLRDELEW